MMNDMRIYAFNTNNLRDELKLSKILLIRKSDNKEKKETW